MSKLYGPDEGYQLELNKGTTGKLIIGKLWRQTAAQLFYDRFRGVFGANSSFVAVSEVVWELIAPNLMILLLFS